MTDLLTPEQRKQASEQMALDAQKSKNMEAQRQWVAKCQKEAYNVIRFIDDNCKKRKTVLLKEGQDPKTGQRKQQTYSVNYFIGKHHRSLDENAMICRERLAPVHSHE